MNLHEYIEKVSEEVKNGKPNVRRRANSLLKALKVKEVTDDLITELQTELDAANLNANLEGRSTFEQNAWLEFSLRGNPNLNTAWMEVEAAALAAKNIPLHAVEEDFFERLFDFGSRYDYERFQASLDSTQPVALFLLPQDEDFFSDIVTRVLNFELIKKHHYKSDDTSVMNLRNDSIRANTVDGKNEEDMWDNAQIFHFSRREMEATILGNNAIEMIESEKFKDQFDRLASYSNRYTSEQFFVLFHCPDLQKIEAQQAQDLLQALISRIAQKIPFVFTLRARYAKESDIPVDIKSSIHRHFKLLNELPSIEILPSLSLNDCFGELQKTFLYTQQRMFFELQSDLFFKLEWGYYDKDEDVYGKYCALRTLTQQYGYSLDQIQCNDKSSYDDEYSTPPVYIENDLAVYFETISGHLQDKNPYLRMFDTYTNRFQNFSSLKQIWLVVPGFEVARNGHLLEQFCRLFSLHCKQKSPQFQQLVLWVVDYATERLVPIDLRTLPALQTKPEIRPLPHIDLVREKKEHQITFKDVIGLEEEKQELNDLIALQEQNFNFGLGGILFYGLPGCGKTHLAQAFANELQRHFFSFSPAEIVSMWIGESAKNVRTIFSEARAKSPAVLFIDELDSIGFSRDEDNAHSDQRATINQLLIEMNNVNEKDLLVISATNRIGSLDPALVRAGRFDYKIPIFPPMQTQRAELFRYYLQRLAKELNEFFPDAVVMKKFDCDWLGEESACFAPADIKSVINKLRIDIIRRRLTQPDTGDVLRRMRVLRDTAQLTLKYDNVKAFIMECDYNGYQSPKLDQLRAEWNLT